MKRRFLALALCALLAAGAAACTPQQEEEPSSSQVSTPSVSVVESEPTPQPTPSATPAPTETPQPTQAPAEGFEGEFAANPIDAKLQEDLTYASSTTLILQAYNRAAARWEALIRSAYEQAGEELSADAYALVQQEQEDWDAGLEPALQNIRAENGEDDLAAASAIVDFYKERARALCQALYSATGALPEFPSTDDEPQG